jgi:hypothetical protein
MNGKRPYQPVKTQWGKTLLQQDSVSWTGHWVTKTTAQSTFAIHYHPHVCKLIEALKQNGIPGVLSRDMQLWHEPLPMVFEEYLPQKYVNKPYPRERVDFEDGGAYSLYNWELFFHGVMLIATRLSMNQRFEEAQRWFHYIFDPMHADKAGLLAMYFNNVKLSGPPVIRLAETINFSWGPGLAAPVGVSDSFSVRWVGKVVSQHSERYTFYTVTDDGVRLWVDNNLLIDGWRDQAVTELSGQIELAAGVPYDIKMEFYQSGGGAVAQLLWASPSTLKAIIPPTQLSSPSYWQFLPFLGTERERLEDLLMLLSTEDGALSEDQQETKQKLREQIEGWEKNEFQPHRIARLRPIAYQKNLVMKYIDNVIAWGDQLFRRDTIESINEATQLYVLAANILGARPERIPRRVKIEPETYASLKKKLDEFANAIVNLQNEFPFSSPVSSAGANVSEESSGLLGLGKTLYFCIPQNDKLLGYWDTVEDRLFKIRHCMNIEGVVRELPLFEPPIDPALLVRAAAAGVDISSVLNDMNAPLPHYCFNVMVQKAIEHCNDVKALGSALLAALDKRDAEELALLRSQHEVKLLEGVREIKKKQIEEAKETLEGLTRYQDVVTAREAYYSGRKMIDYSEQQHLDCLKESESLQDSQATTEYLAALLHLLPDFKIGAPTTMGDTYGGRNVGSSIQTFGAAFSAQASQKNTQGAKAATLASYYRRQDDWKHQAELATKELKQVEKQIAAANIRVQIAEKELENHETQIENAKAVDEYMHSKFTNLELYQWMVSQISGIYFQSYQMAYDIAKRAERAYRHELGLADSNFIQFGYWDSLKKGLLAGEQLHYDLRRMELAYVDQNKREYEITKHISLALLDPEALVRLKETGECFVDLPEAVFDLDYPGHYMRRLKSVSLTIPCVTGPYTGVNCTLTLLKHSVRKSNKTSGSYIRDEKSDDSRFADNIGAIQSITTSSGQNDSGVFELSFRDERWLPFEGAGAVSQWRIELAKDKDLRQFDYDTISDVVFHVKYTAREGGEILKGDAIGALRTRLFDATDGKLLVRMFSAKHEFPSEWYRFLHSTDRAADNEYVYRLLLDMKVERFPFIFQGKAITINAVKMFLKLKEEYKYEQGELSFHFNEEGKPLSSDIKFTKAGSRVGGLPFASPENFAAADIPTKWVLTVQESKLPPPQPNANSWWQVVTINGETHRRLNPEAVEDIWLIYEYTVKNKTV